MPFCGCRGTGGDDFGTDTNETGTFLQSLLDYLNDGYTLDQFLEFFPSVKRDDAKSFLRISRNASDP